MAFIAPIGTAMLRVPAGGLVALTVVVIAMAFTTPCGAAMLRVPAGGLVALTVMVIAMAPIGVAMLRVPAGDLVVLTVMMVASNALVLVTPIEVGMLGVRSISSTSTCTSSCGCPSGSAPSGSGNEVCAFKAAESQMVDGSFGWNRIAVLVDCGLSICLQHFIGCFVWSFVAVLIVALCEAVVWRASMEVDRCEYCFPPEVDWCL